MKINIKSRSNENLFYEIPKNNRRESTGPVSFHSVYDRFLNRKINLYKISGANAFLFKSWMAIDVDGAPNAFHPVDQWTKRPGKLKKSLAYFDTAGRPGNWWALATHNDKPSGRLVVQPPDGPAPGYYVSKTSLRDEKRDHTDQRAYVNSNEIPYIALPRIMQFKNQKELEPRLGDIAAVYNTENQNLVYAIFADLGPINILGEGSIALSRELGADWGFYQPVIIYLVFPKSGAGEGVLRSKEEIDSQGRTLLEEFGGIKKLQEISSIIL